MSSVRPATSHKSGTPFFCIISWWDYLMPAGMSARIDGLISQLKKVGVEPEVITPTFYADYADFSEREATLVKTLNIRWLRYSKKIPESILKILGNIVFSLFSFIVISMRFLFDGRKKGLIVQYQSVFSALPAILARALFKVIVIGDDIRLYSKHRRSPFSWVQRAYETAVIKNTDFVITSYKLDYVLLNYMFDKKNVLFVPNGIKRVSIHSNVSRDPNTAIFVGQFANVDNVKALGTILYIAKKLENFSDMKIYLVGGPLEIVNKMVQQKGSKKTNINVLGRVSQEQLDLLYGKTAVGILPYFGTSKHTSQRIKALEFLSNGLLVVASPRGVDGFAGLKDGRHYVLAKTRDDMANLLEEILLNYGRFARVALAGQEYVIRNHTWDKVAEPYLKLIEHLRSNGFKESSPKMLELAS